MADMSSQLVKTTAQGLSPGGQWLVQQLDAMGGHYRVALTAAILILRYKTLWKNKRPGTRGSPDVPTTLLKRMDVAWKHYIRARQNVEWYLAKNAEVTSNPALTSSTVPDIKANSVPKRLTILPDVPRSSPIPLSTASLLAYDNDGTTVNSSFIDGNIPSVPLPQPLSSYGNPQPTPMSASGNYDLDLAALGMPQISTIMNTQPPASQVMPNLSNDNTDLGAMLASASAAANNVVQGQPPAQTPDGQDETERLLASLAQAGDGADYDMFGGDGQTGEVDLSALMGLFNEATGGGEAGPDSTGLLSALVSSAGAGLVQPTETPKISEEQPLQPAVPELDVAPAGDVTGPAAPKAAGDEQQSSRRNSLAYSQDYDRINIDDFNFGDGAMPSVEDEEFESLFAEFK